MNFGLLRSGLFALNLGVMLPPGSRSPAFPQALELGWVTVGLPPLLPPLLLGPGNGNQWDLCKKQVPCLINSLAHLHPMVSTCLVTCKHIQGPRPPRVFPRLLKQGKTGAGIAGCPLSLMVKLEGIILATRKNFHIPQSGQGGNRSGRV